jgi:flavin reductase (DIM6/NTAB) family NADH-FMN oxidoreductase RutF
MELPTRKRTLRLLSNGVYVMTSASGTRFGAATVTWLSQASFKPPLVMAAVRRDSNVFACLSESGVAAVHILGTDQESMAQRFFSPTKVVGDEINGEPFVRGQTTAPVLRNAKAYFEAVVQHMFTLGDHAVVVMEVVEAECLGDVHPMTVAASPWEYGG